MKKYLLAINNIINMIKAKNKLLFLVFISMSVSMFGMLFYSGYFLQLYYSSEKGSDIAITLFSDTSNEEVEKLINLLEIKDGVIDHLITAPEDEPVVIGEYNKSWDRTICLGKNYSLEEIEPKLFVTESQIDFVEDGDTPIGFKPNFDKNLKIAGVVPYNDYDAYTLPILYYVRNYQTKEIIINYENVLSKKVTSNIREALSNNKNVESFNIARTNNPFASEDFMSEFLLVMLIFGVITINVFCLAYNWVLHFKKNYKIYAVCGGDRRTILEIVMTQTSIVMVLAILLGNIVFVVFQQFVKNYGLIYVSDYNTYFVISIIETFVIMIFSYILARIIVNSNTIYNMVE